MIEVMDGAEQRIALSMKLVNQADGADLDPPNAEAETDVGLVLFSISWSIPRVYTVNDTLTLHVSWFGFLCASLCRIQVSSYTCKS